MKNSLAISIKKALVVGAILGGVLATYPSLAISSDPSKLSGGREFGGARYWGWAESAVGAGLDATNQFGYVSPGLPTTFARASTGNDAFVYYCEEKLGPQATLRQAQGNILLLSSRGIDTHRVFIKRGGDARYRPMVNIVKYGVTSATPRLLGVR